MTDRANPEAITSSISSGTAEAVSATTSRSTGSSRAERLGTARHPSTTVTPGLMTAIRSAGNPAASRLCRITRPGFIRSDTPMTAIDRGRSCCRIPSGGGGRRGVSALPLPRTASASRAIAPAEVNTSGLISNSTRSWGIVVSPRVSRSTASAANCDGLATALVPRDPSVSERVPGAEASVASIRSEVARATIAGARPSPAVTPPGPMDTTGPKASVQRTPARTSSAGS